MIQANERLAFEDGLRFVGLLHSVSHCTSVCNNLADIMDTLKKFKMAMPSKEVKWYLSCEIPPAAQGAIVEQ